MKKLAIIAAVFVLTVSLLTGCGCTNRDSSVVTTPYTEMTILPTNIPETTAPVPPETRPATVPPTQAPTDIPEQTQTGETTETAAAGRSRMR